MSRYYTLDGHAAVPIPNDDVMAFALASQTRYGTLRETGEDPWRVAREEFPDGTSVSTVFLSLDHGWGDGPPLLFETMVFGGPCDGDQERCSTWEQAEVQHAEVVARVKAAAQSNDTTYGGQKALYRRAGIQGAHCHDLRRTSATYVYKETGGNKEAAASFIVDNVATADKHYIQDDPLVRLPSVNAAARVLDRARALAPTH